MLKKFCKYDAPKRAIKCNDYVIDVKVADTLHARTQGLSGLSSMKDNEGMLFCFGNREESQCFHMNGCLFDIEAIAISKEGKILDIKQMKYTEPSITHWLPACSYVLELKAGMCKKMNITLGDYIQDI